MALHFITANAGKYEEVKQYIHEVVQLDIDLPEVQGLDPHFIIRNKLVEAHQHHRGELMVEDTSLYFDALNGMPGPLIKWFLKALGNQGLYELAVKLGNPKATAKTIIGYSDNGSDPVFFEGVVSGKIVTPQGKEGFGWDPIFQPDGYTKTFAQMWEEKNLLSMRKIAVGKLVTYLKNHEKN